MQGDVGLIPGPRRAHQLQSNKAPWATTIEPVPWSPWATTTEPIYRNYWNPSAWRPCSTTREASTTRSPCSATGEQPLLTTTREKPTQQKDPVQAKKRLIRLHISNTYVHFFSSLNKCPLSACVPDPAKVFPSGKSRWASLLEGRSSFKSWSLATLAIWKSCNYTKKWKKSSFSYTGNSQWFYDHRSSWRIMPASCFPLLPLLPSLLLFIIRIAYIYVDLKWLKRKMHADSQGESLIMRLRKHLVRFTQQEKNFPPIMFILKDIFQQKTWQ